MQRFLHLHFLSSPGPPPPSLAACNSSLCSSGWRSVVSRVWSGWSRGAGETHLGRLVCTGNARFLWGVKGSGAGVLDLPEQFQPVGVWQSLKEVGKAASFTGRATISSITGSSSSQQKPSQSVQLLHCRGDSHSTMTSSRNSAAANGFGRTQDRGGQAAGYWASRGQRQQRRRRWQWHLTGKQQPNPRMISRVSATSSDPAQPREREGRAPKSRTGDAVSCCHKQRALASRGNRRRPESRGQRRGAQGGWVEGESKRPAA